MSNADRGHSAVAERGSRTDERNNRTEERGTRLEDSPTMAHLLDSLRRGEDVGHFGRLTFAMVARHFLDEDEIVNLLARQPDQDETKARAMLLQCQGRDYNPPKRDRLLEWQAQQDYQMVDPDDPNSGNLYRELQFPDAIYENIQEFYEEQVEDPS